MPPAQRSHDQSRWAMGAATRWAPRATLTVAWLLQAGARLPVRVEWCLTPFDARWLGCRRGGTARSARGHRPSGGGGQPHPPPRSEEHTSELQSLMRLSYAVFCLKKKKKTHKQMQQHDQPSK